LEEANRFTNRALTDAQGHALKQEEIIFQHLRTIKDLEAVRGVDGSYSDLQRKYQEEKQANIVKYRKLAENTKERARSELDKASTIELLTSERDCALAKKDQYKMSYLRHKNAEKRCHRQIAAAELKVELLSGTNKALLKRLTILESERLAYGKNLSSHKSS